MSPHLYTDRVGVAWDLNDPETYTKSWLPNKFAKKGARGLRRAVEDTIGYALHYMICAYPEWPRDQYTRIVEFGKHFAREVREPDRYENKEWLRKQLFLILDETENMC